MIPRPRWTEMRTTDFGDCAGWIAVLPLAAIEQHGPHLPLGTDTMIAEAMVTRVIDRLAGLPVSFLPVQAVAKSDEHIAFPGTLTLGWETALKAWLEIGASVARAGVGKIVVVTSHGGNVAPMGVLTRELRIAHGMLAVATAWAAGAGTAHLLPEGEAAYGIHGGAAETAMMLAIAPATVDMAAARDFRTAELSHAERFAQLRAHGGPAPFGWMAQDLHPDGAAGDASVATAAAGEALLEAHAEAFLALLRDVDAADPGTLLRSGPLGG